MRPSPIGGVLALTYRLAMGNRCPGEKKKKSETKLTASVLKKDPKHTRG